MVFWVEYSESEFICNNDIERTKFRFVDNPGEEYWIIREGIADTAARRISLLVRAKKDLIKIYEENPEARDYAIETCYHCYTCHPEPFYWWERQHGFPRVIWSDLL